MPLLLPILQQELDRIMNADNGRYVGIPKDQVTAANNWANALATYAKDVIPESATLELAKAVFITEYSKVNKDNGKIQIPFAFAQFALELSVGMAPAFAATPPATPIDFSAVEKFPMKKESISSIVQMTALILDTWFRTGIAVNSATGVSLIWS